MNLSDTEIQNSFDRVAHHTNQRNVGIIYCRVPSLMALTRETGLGCIEIWHKDTWLSKAEDTGSGYTGLLGIGNFGDDGGGCLGKLTTIARKNVNQAFLFKAHNSTHLTFRAEPFDRMARDQATDVGVWNPDRISELFEVLAQNEVHSEEAFVFTTSLGPFSRRRRLY